MKNKESISKINDAMNKLLDMELGQYKSEGKPAVKQALEFLVKNYKPIVFRPDSLDPLTSPLSWMYTSFANLHDSIRMGMKNGDEDSEMAINDLGAITCLVDLFASPLNLTREERLNAVRMFAFCLNDLSYFLYSMNTGDPSLQKKIEEQETTIKNLTEALATFSKEE